GAVRSGLVGVAAALRASAEPLLPGRALRTARDWLVSLPPVEPSAARVPRRRLGRTWSSRLVEPLLEGIYGVPATELGFAAALPQFAGARTLVGAARRVPVSNDPAFLSVRGGMGRLAERLVESLEEADLRLRTPALAVSRR